MKETTITGDTKMKNLINRIINQVKTSYNYTGWDIFTVECITWLTVLFCLVNGLWIALVVVPVCTYTLMTLIVADRKKTSPLAVVKGIVMGMKYMIRGR